MEKDKVDKNVAMNSLWSAFPSVAGFIDFKKTDHEVSARAIPRIIKFAHRNDISETLRGKPPGILNSKEGDCIPLTPAPHSSPPLMAGYSVGVL